MSMASSRPAVKTRSAADSDTLLKIDTLNIDVFVMILQEVIDEEADRHLGSQGWLFTSPKAATTLALVCKKWRDIVYSTPSFWFTIKLSMGLDSNEVQAKLNRAADRAKNVPVDLHILHVHSDEGSRLSSKHHSNNCCCKSGSISICLDLSRLLNVRRLLVRFEAQNGFSFLDPSSLPFLKQVEWVEFRLSRLTEVAQSFDLEHFLHYSPCLTDLRLNCVEIYNVSWAQASKPLIPNLRTLRTDTVNLYASNSLSRLAQILSHAPNLEELTMPTFGRNITNLTPPAEYFQNVNSFPKLRRIHTDRLDIIKWLFIDGCVTIPNLQDFGYDERFIKDNERSIEIFFASHQSIKELSVWVTDGPAYGRRIRWISNLETLTIQGTGREGQWLKELYTPISEGEAEILSYPCPNLRTITISDFYNAILPSSFDEFVRIRCLPVSENRYTVAGCTAVEVLKVELSSLTNGRSLLTSTDAWKKAKVWKISDKRYELRWTYRPEHVSSDMKTRD